MMRQLLVNLPSSPYSVTIERGLLNQLGARIRPLIASRRVMLAADAQIAGSHGRVAAASLLAAGLEVVVHQIAATESNKVIDTVTGMHQAMLEARLERGSTVIALGGGIVGDIASFAAATWMRGTPIVQVPTTLLAMVDAAIGGKTGVNLRGADGRLAKNMVGAFWQPKAVLTDVDTLGTLPPRHLRCGLAECVKHGVISSPELIAFLETHAGKLEARESGSLESLVALSAAVKVAIVQQDEREAGNRALLNLGHTFGHALEGLTQLDLLHGEAVAIGLVAAMSCAVQLGLMKAHDRRRVIDLLASLGLPQRVSQAVPAQSVLSAMQHDKKVVGGRLRLVLPMGIGQAVLRDDVSPDVVLAALAEIGVES